MMNIHKWRREQEKKDPYYFRYVQMLRMFRVENVLLIIMAALFLIFEIKDFQWGKDIDRDWETYLK